MKAIVFLIPLLSLFSCNDYSGDPGPEIPVETVFIIGDLENTEASYFQINQEMETSLETVSQESKAYQFDIDEDGTYDLRFTISSVSEEFNQEIRILPLNSLSMGKSHDLGDFNGVPTSMVATLNEGTELKTDEINWTTSQLLFAYRIRNQNVLPYSIDSMDQAYIPVQKNGKAGWLSFQIERDENDTAGFSKIRLFIYSRNNE